MKVRQIWADQNEWSTEWKQSLFQREKSKDIEHISLDFLYRWYLGHNIYKDFITSTNHLQFTAAFPGSILIWPFY